ncbi:MAG: aspartate 1-decarboxylase [Lentisphaeria bacterium]
MQIHILKSKMHQARITECELHYEGSLGIDLALMDEVGMLPYERILVVNASNGERLETYAIPEKRGSKTFCLNGAAARRGQVGDQITIMSFAGCSPEEAATLERRVIVLNANNQIIKKRP